MTKQTFAGYSITSEIKIVRRKHKIMFRVGERIDTLVTLLAKIPGNATVDEVICDDDNVTSIEFHEEYSVKE